MEGCLAFKIARDRAAQQHHVIYQFLHQTSPEKVSFGRAIAPYFVNQISISNNPARPEDDRAEPARRHDLDALRAAAMLLGVAYHSSLSFSLGPGWVVQDVHQSKALYVFQAFVHGFQMQLFMLLSGFFTAMLWRKLGLKGLLRNRLKRILLPCLAGLITVVPATKWVVSVANKARNERGQVATQSASAVGSVWDAIRTGNLQAVEEHLKSPESITERHPVFGLTTLSWASLAGSKDIVGMLLEKGADVHWRSADGHTALHGAAFLGRYEVTQLLLDSGADMNAPSLAGERPMHSASTDYSTVEYITRLLGIAVQKEQVLEGRRRIKMKLEDLGAETGKAASVGDRGTIKQAIERLTQTPVFILVWFLWFLVWLLPPFSLYAFAAERFGWKMRPHPLIVSQLSLLWLVPLTVIPAWFMGSGRGEFGPDTSMGIIPVPHVLAYYALFFGFGALYFECAGTGGRLETSWRWTLPLSLLLVFPLALEFATGTFGLRDRLRPAEWHRAASVVLQTLYAWTMSFGWMGLFCGMISREHRSIRYLSEASYWIYMAHLPLVITVQAAVCTWTLPAMVKFLLSSLIVSAVMLLSYEKLVRRTLIGRFLNGRRPEPGARREA